MPINFHGFAVFLMVAPRIHGLMEKWEQERQADLRRGIERPVVDNSTVFRTWEWRRLGEARLRFALEDF